MIEPKTAVSNLQDFHPHRVHFLDGIRGWAALFVVFNHLIGGLLTISTPQLVYDKAVFLEHLAHFQYGSVIFDTFIRFVTDGHLAVYVFFVLSGYALSFHQINFSKRNLALAASSRYFRLMIPIVITTLITYAVMRMSLIFNLQIAPQASSDWIRRFFDFNATLKGVLSFSFYDVFFNYNDNKTYNPALWTMPIEIIGSFLIYGFLGLFRENSTVQWKIAIIIATHFFFSMPAYACFFIGYLIAELNSKFSINSNKVENVLIERLCLLAFALTSILSTYYIDSDKLVCLFASVMILSVSYSYSLKHFFSNTISNFLGRISFPLYLIHFLVICSWSSFVYIVSIDHHFNLTVATYFNLISSTVICLVLSYLLLPVESLSIRASKKIGHLFLTRD